MEPFKVFLSHRHEDAAIAAQLARTLRMYGIGNLELSHSANVIHGKDWRESIEGQLRRAELLLLLLTAPSDFSSGWDWSLFEVGYFSRFEGTQKRIIALSPPNLEIPSPLAKVQHIQAVRDQVTWFLEELFVRTGLTGRDVPINTDFAKDRSRVEDLAGEICALLAPLSVGSRMHAHSLILKFEESPHEPVIAEDVEIEIDAMSLKMFGLLERGKFTWGDIHRSLHGETTWISELSEAIYAIASGRYAKPIKSTFPSAEGQSFIPVVYRDETRSSGLRLFHILFVPTDVAPVNPDLVFVISAFRNDMEPIYEAIEAAATNYSLSAKRVKDIVGDYRITDKILHLISQAKYVVADLTHERPNVYFELGYARGLGKTVITTVRKGTTVHFDVKDWTYIEYDDSRNLERQLVERLKAEKKG
jgi:TIR domain